MESVSRKPRLNPRLKQQQTFAPFYTSSTQGHYSMGIWRFRYQPPGGLDGAAGDGMPQSIPGATGKSTGTAVKAYM